MVRGALGWCLHRATGAVLFIGMAVHFYMMHMGGPAAVSYEAVTARLGSPGWKAFNLLLLLSVIYHGFYGLWGIVLEYVHSRGPLFLFKSLLLGSAGGLVVVGIFLLGIW